MRLKSKKGNFLKSIVLAALMLAIVLYGPANKLIDDSVFNLQQEIDNCYILKNRYQYRILRITDFNILLDSDVYPERFKSDVCTGLYNSAKNSFPAEDLMFSQAIEALTHKNHPLFFAAESLMTRTAHKFLDLELLSTYLDIMSLQDKKTRELENLINTLNQFRAGSVSYKTFVDSIVLCLKSKDMETFGVGAFFHEMLCANVLNKSVLLPALREAAIEEGGDYIVLEKQILVLYYEWKIKLMTAAYFIECEHRC